MKKIINFLGVLPIMIVMPLFFMGCEPAPKAKKAQNKETLFETAVKLVNAQMDYLKAKKNNDWEKIYGMQTAYFKKKVPFEEFVYHGGKLKPDWKEELLKKSGSQRICGRKITFPSIKEMREKIEKEKPKFYEPHFGSFGWRVSKFKPGENVKISLDGKYGRTNVYADVFYLSLVPWQTTLEGDEFWDLEEDGWRVQLNRWDYRPISGMTKPPGPDITYKSFPLSDFIDYHFKKADYFYSKGIKSKAKNEYRRAVELRPLETYSRVPLDDPEIKNFIKPTVLEKIREWNQYLDHQADLIGFKVETPNYWSKEDIKAKRVELKKIFDIFNNKQDK